MKVACLSCAGRWTIPAVGEDRLMRPALVILLNASILGSQLLCLTHSELPGEAFRASLQWTRPHFHLLEAGGSNAVGQLTTCCTSRVCRHLVVSGTSSHEEALFLPELGITEESAARPIERCGRSPAVVSLIPWQPQLDAAAEICRHLPRIPLEGPVYLRTLSIRC